MQNQLRVQLLSIAQDRVNRDASLVFVSHIARLIIGLGSSVLLARGLGPTGLGMFGVVGAFGFVASTIADFGLSNAGVSRLARIWNGDPTRTASTARTLIILKAAIAGVFVIPVIVFAGPLARLALATDNAALLLQITFVGVFVRAVGSGFSAILQAVHEFKTLTVSQLLNSLGTLLLVAAFFWSARLDVATALIIGVLASGMSALITAQPVIARMRFLSARQSPSRDIGAYIAKTARNDIYIESRALLRFGKWLWVSAIFSILAVQLDLFVLNRMVEPALVGFYSLALSLAFNADIVQQSLFAVLLPRASALKQNEYRKYLRENLSRTMALGIALAALIPLARVLLPVLYGDAFIPAADVFALMMVVVIFDLLTMPLILLAFPMQRPRVLALSDILRAATLLMGLWLFVPIGSLNGAVLAKFLSRVAGASVMFFVAMRAFRTRAT